MSARVRSEPSPARSRPRRKSPSSPASHRPASPTSSPCGPNSSRKRPMLLAPPIGTTEMRSASRFRPRRSASASSATWSLTPSTSTTVRRSASMASARASPGRAAGRLRGLPSIDSDRLHELIFERTDSHLARTTIPHREIPAGSVHFSSSSPRSTTPRTRRAIWMASAPEPRHAEPRVLPLVRHTDAPLCDRPLPNVATSKTTGSQPAKVPPVMSGHLFSRAEPGWWTAGDSGRLDGVGVSVGDVRQLVPHRSAAGYLRTSAGGVQQVPQTATEESDAGRAGPPRRETGKVTTWLVAATAVPGVRGRRSELSTEQGLGTAPLSRFPLVADLVILAAVQRDCRRSRRAHGPVQDEQRLVGWDPMLRAEPYVAARSGELDAVVELRGDHTEVEVGFTAAFLVHFVDRSPGCTEGVGADRGVAVGRRGPVPPEAGVEVFLGRCLARPAGGGERDRIQSQAGPQPHGLAGDEFGDVAARQHGERVRAAHVAEFVDQRGELLDAPGVEEDAGSPAE